MFSLKMSKTFSDTSTNQQFIEISRFHFNFHNAHIENELIFYHFRFNFHRPITPSRPWAQENDRLTSKSMVQNRALAKNPKKKLHHLLLTQLAGYRELWGDASSAGALLMRRIARYQRNVHAQAEGIRAGRQKLPFCTRAFLRAFTYWHIEVPSTCSSPSTLTQEIDRPHRRRRIHV